MRRVKGEDDVSFFSMGILIVKDRSFFINNESFPHG